MFKPGRRDFQVVFNTIVYGLLGLALLQAFGSYLFPDPKREEIGRYMQELATVEPAALPEILHPGDGKPVMFVIYASWCPACKQLMPMLATLIRGGELEGIRLVFLSIDERHDRLASYIIHQEYKGLFKPYVIKYSQADQLMERLQRQGIGFNGGIPYTGFFDGQGKAVAEYLGMVDKGSLLETISKLKH